VTAGTGACQSLGGAPGEYPDGLQQLGDGVYAWLQPNGDWGEANAGLVLGSDTSLLVDTLWDPELAGQMLTAMAPVTAGAPLSTVINTHRDGDHWWGNLALPDDVEILATAAAADEMTDEPPPASLHRLAALSRLGAALPGSFGRLSRYTRQMLGPFAFAGRRTRPPTRTFTGDRPIRGLDRPVTAIEVGPAHTAGDAVVHLPDAGVVFCGDVAFVGVTPVVWHSVTGWSAAISRVLALDADRYVPGHGPVGTREDLAELQAYLGWLTDAGTACHARGDTPREAMRALARDPELDRWRGWHRPERLALNVVALFRELAGRPPLEPTGMNRVSMFYEVADLQRFLSR
jgi:cyclase